ncbi:hypothetical protein CK203_034671 [Vitis vinifera]|uniref:Uncharacterized protein n=1 Tax=Vitis vinifera TaxID=29760 RepID=A0A438HWC1_VITVI|nr:hypothetical protein CK203_034671 [Vitis vinifera]
MFNMEEAKTMKTPMSSSINFDKDEKGKPIDSTMYRGMIGLKEKELVALVLGHSLVSWHSKKQNLVVLSMAEAEYILAGESWLPLGHRASAQLSRLNRRLVERRDLTSPYLVPWRIINGTNKSLLREKHQDEVSYYEAFLMDPILTGRRIHLGYLMMMHMISCCESTTHVLPYSRFFTRVFKDVGVDLSRETYFEAPNSYDTYDDLSIGQMKFEKLEGVQFKATFFEWMVSEPTYIAEPSSQPSFIEPPHVEIPPHQVPHAPDHVLWMDLSPQISSRDTSMEEFIVQRFESMEDRTDQHQATFEHLQQMIERIEGRQESQHEEMMAYLRFVFPPPPPQP